MKWRTAFQRDQPESSSPSPTAASPDLFLTAIDSDDNSTPTFLFSPPDHHILSSQHSSPALLHSEPLLSTKDIEALIQEDEERHSSDHPDHALDADPPQAQIFRDESSSSLDYSWPITGLPAPPRGPRKVVTPSRERLGRQRSRAIREGSSTPVQDPEASVQSNPSMTIGVSTKGKIEDDGPSSTTPPQLDIFDGKWDQESGAFLKDLNFKMSKDSSPNFNQTEHSNDSQKLAEVTICSQFDVSGSNDLQQRTRPLLSHAHTNSQDSSFSQSFSSHEPASTSYEPCISISSTIYPSSVFASSVSQDPHILAREERSDTGPIVEISSAQISSTSIPSSEPSPGRQRVTLTIPSQIPVTAFPDVSPIDFADRDQVYGSSSLDTSSRPSLPVKPPIPETPKPIFRRSHSANPTSKSMKSTGKLPTLTASPKTSSRIPYNLLTSFTNSDNGMPLPPTTNNLDPAERADLVRKTRKLAQVLGQTPSPVSAPEEAYLDSPIMHNCLLPMIPSRKNHLRVSSSSTSEILQPPGVLKLSRDRRLSPLAGPGEESPNLSPITFRSSYFWRDDDAEDTPSPSDSPVAQTPRSPRVRSDPTSLAQSPSVVSSESFIDFGDTPSHDQTSPTISYEESIAESRKAEDERRRKRERLAKLHRFLGARVPAELILSPHEMGVPLPALADNSFNSEQTLSDSEDSSPHKIWKRGRRRNSLATSSPSYWLSDSDRMKADLTGNEKALIVKRALKMEKLFGEQPPQDLFYGRRTVSICRLAVKTPELSSSAPSSPVIRNINRSAYRKARYPKRNDDRPGTGDSSKGLLGGSYDSSTGDASQTRVGGMTGGASSIYVHYRHSLISLADIVNRDDRESLVDLHDYLYKDDVQRRAEVDRGASVRTKSEASLRSERRRSLPLQPSLTSLASQATVDVTSFQARRRRAAKLSHFFGVSYKDLFGEILESLEMGVQEEGGKGSLNPDEVQDLLARLRKLRKRRDDFS